MTRERLNTGYKFKPKSERVPPVWKERHELLDFNERRKYWEQSDEHYKNIWGANHQRVRDVLSVSYSIHNKPGKSTTLIVQERVLVRYDYQKNTGTKDNPEYETRWTSLFARNETISMYTAYLTSKGNVAFYCYNINRGLGGGHRSAGKTTFNPLTSDTMGQLIYLRGLPTPTGNLRDRFEAIAAENLGVSVDRYKVYPLLTRNRAIRIEAKHLRHDTARDFVASFYGKKYLRKDLIRAVGACLKSSGNSHLDNVLVWTEMFKGLVPID